jgi:hypothetical protein
VTFVSLHYATRQMGKPANSGALDQERMEFEDSLRVSRLVECHNKMAKLYRSIVQWDMRHPACDRSIYHIELSHCLSQTRNNLLELIFAESTMAVSTHVPQ